LLAVVEVESAIAGQTKRVAVAAALVAIGHLYLEKILVEVLLLNQR